MEEALAGLLGRKRYVRVGGVEGAALGLVLAGVARTAPALLVVASDPKAADALALDFSTFAGRPPLAFPAWPHEPEGTLPDTDVLGARVRALEVLRAIRAGGTSPVPVLVAPLAALAQDVPSPIVVDAATLGFEPGETHPQSALLEHLALSGFVRVPAVESPGEFSSRGGVVDLYPFGAPTAWRLDFFGDVIESIRPLDVAARSTGEPAARIDLLCLPPSRVREPAASGGPAFLLEHVPAGAVVVIVEPATVAAKVSALSGEAGPGRRVRWKRLTETFSASRRLELSALRLGSDGDLDVGAMGLDDLRGVAARAEAQASRRGAAAGRATPQSMVAEAFRRLAGKADRVVVFRRAAGEEERLRELLSGGDRAAGAHLSVAGVPVAFAEGSISRSFLYPPTRTAYLAYDDLADLSVRERRPASGLPPSRPIQDFLELELGAPVVHLHHGIGVFRGLVAGESRSGPGQFLAIEFAEGTTVHVPVSRIDLVQRYVGTGRRPRLSTIGGSEWGVRKEKVATAVADLAQELLEVQALRRKRQGGPVRPHPEWQDEFEKAFPWRDTADQATATIAIKADLAGPRPMDRLLCGDVGYGKTEVALRAAFLVAAAGKQVAVLVPTTVLSEQHLRTFAARLAPYPLVVRALSRFRTPAETREILAGLSEGAVDIVIGTHRLLSKDVVFSNLGLVVVDEEQRFGVQHKERLKALRADVDVLTLSATPIPRTLHMALLGIRDISNLTTPPPGRLAIDTKVARADEVLVRETLRRELDRGGQCFLVHNRVFDLDVIAGTVMRLLPDARVTTVNGQMDKDLVEERMMGFVRGDVDVLVTTTIVESGLDIPNANTMVIHNADRFGLAELHQLRGRVGRETRHAHCLLLVAKDRALSEEAAHRLRALEEYSELGAGFRIAMRDLELRGAGNLLGAQQSGHIASVGYDLYCKLLAEAVKAATRDAPRNPEAASVEVELPCAIPAAYVADPRETFRWFRRISTAPSIESLATLREELSDRFGPPPPETERLFLNQAARLLSGAAGIARVGSAERGGLSLEVADPAALDRVSARGVAFRRIDPFRAYVPPPAGPAGEGIATTLARSLAALVKAFETR